MSTHAVTIATTPVVSSEQRVKWACTCGEGRLAESLLYAAADAQGHLRRIEDGLPR